MLTSTAACVECWEYSRIRIPLLDHAPNHIRQHAAISAIAVCLFASGLIAWGWWIWQPHPKPDSSAFAVSGFSMAPTLLGQTQTWRCKDCLFTARLAPANLSQSERCPQCTGELFPLEDLHPPDLVFRGKPSSPIQLNDLVAIELDRPSVKRVVAMPGDIVGLDGLQLTVNAKPIDNDASVLVYRRTKGKQSRWKQQGDWMVYHHVNVHRGSMPSGVLDDYSINRNLSRLMYPADRLYVALTSTGESPQDIDIQIWKRGDRQTMGVPVSETAPVAIAMADWQAVPDIEIRRKILYRLRPHDDPSKYPITLGPREYFVLGDNVPISVDSRDFGPLKHDKIRARLFQ